MTKEALRSRHFSETGENLSDEHAARYGCLLSYENHAELSHLNRLWIRQIIGQLAQSTLEIEPQTRSREDQYKWLLERVDPRSSLEQELLELLYRQGFCWPDDAQHPIPAAGAITDFLYGPNVLVFCDGPDYDTPDHRERDSQQRQELRNRGYRVVVIRYDVPLAEQVARYPEIFGQGAGTSG